MESIKTIRSGQVEQHNSNQPKEWLLSDLYVGMLFTGNKYCFQGRIEIIKIDEDRKTIDVYLTKEIGDKFSHWREEWEIKNVLNGLTIGEYHIENYWDANYMIPYTIKGCFNQIISIMNNTLNQKRVHNHDMIIKYPDNKAIPMVIITIPETNLYAKQYNIYETLLIGFIEKLCIHYQMDYILSSDVTIIMIPKSDNKLLWS